MAHVGTQMGEDTLTGIRIYSPLKICLTLWTPSCTISLAFLKSEKLEPPWVIPACV